jgi:hypothetical protein
MYVSTKDKQEGSTMSTNQPPFAGNTNQQGSTIPKKVELTNRHFPPRLHLEAAPPSDGTQPFSQSTSAQFDSTQPFLPEQNPSTQLDSTQQLYPGQNTTAQFDNSQTSILNNAPRDMMTRQLENPGTGALTPPIGQYSGDTGMLTLNHAVKVVRIPVAGKPGEFKTGILPVIPQSQTGALPPPSASDLSTPKPKRKGKLIVFVALIFLVLLGSGGYYLLSISNSTHATATTRTKTTNGGTTKNQGQGQTTNPAATAAAGATATAVANASLLLADPLSSSTQIRDWTTGEIKESQTNYAFKNGAYHIHQDGQFFGYTLIPGIDAAPPSYTYTLTMKLENYDNTSTGDRAFFAMVLNHKFYGSNNATFYVFRVNISNSGNISYEFDKYDYHNSNNPWKQLFPSTDNDAGNGQGNSKEFKGGPHSPQVYSVTDINGTFTLSVNGTKIGTVKDTQFTGGNLGMGVNQSKTEASFTNLSLYKN